MLFEGRQVGDHTGKNAVKAVFTGAFNYCVLSKTCARRHRRVYCFPICGIKTIKCGKAAALVPRSSSLDPRDYSAGAG
jgi:hypothetical protein